MVSKEEIIKLIYSSIDELNKTLSEKEKLNKSPDQIIMGEGGNLDSLGFVNFVVDLEEKLNGSLQAEITLTDDEDIVNMNNSPFKNVETLTSYLLKIVNG